jgi:hypothetical protein
MENVKVIFEGTRPIREGTTAIGLCLALINTYHKILFLLFLWLLQNQKKHIFRLLVVVQSGFQIHVRSVF